MDDVSFGNEHTSIRSCYASVETLMQQLYSTLLSCSRVFGDSVNYAVSSTFAAALY